MQKLKTIVLLLSLIIPSGAMACTCVGSSLKEAVAGTGLIAVAQILRLDTVMVKHESANSPDRVYGKYTVVMDEKLKGAVVADTITVYSDFSSCGYVFKSGLKYIIFGHSNPFSNMEIPFDKNTFWTNNCTYTSSFNERRAREIKEILKPGWDKLVPVKLDK